MRNWKIRTRDSAFGLSNCAADMAASVVKENHAGRVVISNDSGREEKDIKVELLSD